MVKLVETRGPLLTYCPVLAVLVPWQATFAPGAGLVQARLLPGRSSGMQRRGSSGASLSGPHSCYGPDNAGHTTAAKSPEKKLPLSEIMLVNSMMGIPSGEWSTTTASNTCLPVNITPG